MRATVFLSISVIFAYGPVAAQDGCFCLVHERTDTIVRFGCEARRIPNRVSERVVCQTNDFVARETVANHENFARLEEGLRACNPCYVPKCREGEECIADMLRLPLSLPVAE